MWGSGCLIPCFVEPPAGSIFCFERHNCLPRIAVCLKVRIGSQTVRRLQKEEPKFAFMYKKKQKIL